MSTARSGARRQVRWRAGRESLAARAVLGLLPPRVGVTAGSIMFDGQDLTKATPAQLAKIRGAIAVALAAGCGKGAS